MRTSFEKKGGMQNSQRGQQAYFFVHSAAVSSNLARFVRYKSAFCGSRGSFGFGSFRRLTIASSTLEMVNAGDQLSLSTSMQIAPLLLTLQWKILVVKRTAHGLNG